MKKKISTLLSLASVFLLLLGCSSSIFEDRAPTESTNNLGGDTVLHSFEEPASELYADSDMWYGNEMSDFSLSDVLPDMAMPSQTWDGADDEWRHAPIDGTDQFTHSKEQTFTDAKTSPLSTFSISVNTASYSIMRRQIMSGQEPKGMRIEELINFFDYDYPAPPPGSQKPFSVISEVSDSPWSPGHLLAKVAIQGVRLQSSGNIANNVVFLIDVSGSMDRPDRLPLVIDSMKLLLEQLGENDVISIVTYAGSERILADSIPGSQRRELTRIIDNLHSGGSTAGAQALRTAYELADKNFIEGGNNRIILATDGDFNVGERSRDDLIGLVESKRDLGIYISVLGYGMGNLNDNMMEAIAAHGNGNYAYIDTIQEAQKVLVDEFDSTMFTIANDVKIQIEFNPEIVGAYRLIGYDTRRLANEDFNNDQIDSGDIGSGHNVTAFFEIKPAGMANTDGLVDPPRYSSIVTTGSDDFMTVRIRYKDPGESQSKLTEHVVGQNAYTENVSENFMFASAVVEFGLIVTDSTYRANSSIESVLSRAGNSLGEDRFKLRAEFLDLVERYARIANW